MIKQILFDVNSVTVEGRDEAVVRVDDLVDILREPLLTNPVKQDMEYTDFLYAPVKTFQK